MKLSDLLKGTDNAVVVNYAERSVRGLELDSRRIRPGGLFACVAGPNGDGTRFVPDAIGRGAVAVLASRRVHVPHDVTLVLMPDVRRALADLCRRFYGCPADLVRTAGVTGTNGKTTVATLVRALLTTAGKQAALISTVVHQIGSRRIPARNTTPESPQLQAYFAEMVERDIGYAVMEVSSHSLAQERVRGIPFEVAALTNITPHEHEDFHGNYASYRAAKARLFESLAPGATAVLNRDDKEFPFFCGRTQANVMTYGLGGPADVTASIRSIDLDGMTLILQTPMGQVGVRSALVGRYNVLNLLAGACCALAFGVDLASIATGLERFTGAPGRLERVEAGQAFTVLVDYAHNAHGLESVLATVRALAKGRLIVVFGAGGNRDASKRPLMGQAAACADVAFVTADNSRLERTEDIIGAIVAGMPAATPPSIEPDRREAIRKAIEMALPGDVVLIAGKGHESYQEIGGVRYPFDDREEARRVLLNLAARRAKEASRAALTLTGIS